MMINIKVTWETTKLMLVSTCNWFCETSRKRTVKHVLNMFPLLRRHDGQVNMINAFGCRLLVGGNPWNRDREIGWNSSSKGQRSQEEWFPLVHVVMYYYCYVRNPGLTWPKCVSNSSFLTRCRRTQKVLIRETKQSKEEEEEKRPSLGWEFWVIFPQGNWRRSSLESAAISDLVALNGMIWKPLQYEIRKGLWICFLSPWNMNAFSDCSLYWMSFKKSTGGWITTNSCWLFERELVLKWVSWHGRPCWKLIKAYT